MSSGRVFTVAELSVYHAPNDSGRRMTMLVDPLVGPLSKLKAGISELSGGTETPVAEHESEEMYFILDGNGWVEVSGERHSVAAGSVVLIAANEAHRISAAGTTIRYFWASSEPMTGSRVQQEWTLVTAMDGRGEQ